MGVEGNWDLLSGWDVRAGAGKWGGPEAPSHEDVGACVFQKRFLPEWSVCNKPLVSGWSSRGRGHPRQREAISYPSWFAGYVNTDKG